MRIIAVILIIILLPLQTHAQDIDWSDIEGTGTLRSIRSGAFEKTIWDNQNRSEILNLIRNLPNAPKTEIARDMQRRLLISYADTDEIQNDIEPDEDNNLLNVRIQKLFKMGLLDDAYALYTEDRDAQNIEPLARMSMILKIYQNKLARACLDTKILAPQYPDSAFWYDLENICKIKLESAEDIAFKGPVFQSVFYDPDFTVKAEDATKLLEFSSLERAIIALEGKLDFDGFGIENEDLEEIEPLHREIFLMAPNISDTLKDLLETQAFKSDISEQIQAIKQYDSEEEQWDAIRDILTSDTNLVNLEPLAKVINSLEPENVEPEAATKTFVILLHADIEISDFWGKKFAELAPDTTIPILQTAHDLGFSIYNPKVSVENYGKAIENMDIKKSDQLLAITTILDNEYNLLNNPALIYEKQLGLTQVYNYVIPSLSFVERLRSAHADRQVGMTVLLSLYVLNNAPDTVYPWVLREVLLGLDKVGLTGDTYQIARELLIVVLLNS